MIRSPVMRRRDNRSFTSSRGRSSHRYHIARRLPRSFTPVAPQVGARHYATARPLRRQNRIAVVRSGGHVDPMGTRREGSRPVHTARLLQRLDQAWEALRESYAGLSDAELLRPGVTGTWSIKDIIAHVTWWEEEALKHLPLILAGGRPPRYSVTYGGIDAFNAKMTKQRQNLTLAEVLRQRDDVHGRLIALVRSAPETQVTGETRFRRRLRLDTYGHYPKHARAIRAWRNTALPDRPPD